MNSQDDGSFSLTCLILTVLVTLVVILLISCVTVTMMICRSQRNMMVSDYDISY